MKDFNIRGSEPGTDPEEPIGAIAPPLKPIKVTLFTMILHNLKHNIRDTESLFSLKLSVETIL